MFSWCTFVRVRWLIIKTVIKLIDKYLSQLLPKIRCVLLYALFILFDIWDMKYLKHGKNLCNENSSDIYSFFTFSGYIPTEDFNYSFILCVHASQKVRCFKMDFPSPPYAWSYFSSGEIVFWNTQESMLMAQDFHGLFCTDFILWYHQYSRYLSTEWWVKYCHVAPCVPMHAGLSFTLNLLTPKSDQDKISPYYIDTISCRQVMRIKENIHYGITYWSHSKFSKRT